MLASTDESRTTWRRDYPVGLFKKKVPEAPAIPDEALTFLSVAAANEFRKLVREAFAELGIEAVMHPDHAVDDTGRQFGFWNVAAQCAVEDRSEWPNTIRNHVGRVLADMDGPDPFHQLDPADAAQRTYARIYASDSFPSLDAYPHREFVPGVVEVLALDLPESVAFYRHQDANSLGGWQALQAAGIANLQSLPVDELEALDVPGGGRFHALIGDSVYTASQALLLPGLAAQLSGEKVSDFGWLMSVPNRHQLTWHMIHDGTVINVINGMARFTLLGHSDAPGPVSPHVYWWNGSAYEQLTEIDDAGTLSIHPSPEFTEVLNSVVGNL